MKRVLMVCIILTLILPWFSVHASAEEYTDPWGNEIPTEVVELANLEEDEDIYESYLIENSIICQYRNLEEILACPRCNREYRYFAKVNNTDGRVSNYKYYNEGNMVEIMGTGVVWSFFDLQQRFYILNPDVIIEKAYYFNGGTPQAEDVAYYRTNAGDFVVTSRVEGVMTGEEFFAYLHARQFKRETGLDLYEGGDAEDVVWVYVGIGALLLVGVVEFCLLRAKKKKDEEFEISEIE